MFSSVLNAFTPTSNRSTFQERNTQILFLSDAHRSIDFILSLEEIEIEYTTPEEQQEWLSNLSQNRLYRLYFTGMLTILISLSAAYGKPLHNQSIHTHYYNNVHEESSALKKNTIILCAVLLAMVSVDLIGKYYTSASPIHALRNTDSPPPDYPTVLKNGHPPPAYTINLQHQTELKSIEDAPKYTTCENSATRNWIKLFNFS